MYKHYKKARNKAWEVLIDCEIKSLPVNLTSIAKRHSMPIIKYSKSALMQAFRKDVLNGDGFITHIDESPIKYIFINDKINNRNRRRFTLAHELGHGMLEHNISEIHYRNNEIDNQTDMQEFEANVFARDLLMPSTVLEALDIHTAEEIMNLCHISRQSAEIRAARMKELYKRDRFNVHPLEKNVKKIFKDFIDNYRK